MINFITGRGLKRTSRSLQIKKLYNNVKDDIRIYPSSTIHSLSTFRLGQGIRCTL